MVFRGNIVTGITGNTFSDQGVLFGAFLMKNIFIKFPTPILTHNFCMISSKNPMIFIGFILTGTVGLPIVNQPYHVHDRTLYCGARRPVNFEVMVFEG